MIWPRTEGWTRGTCAMHQEFEWSLGFTGHPIDASHPGHSHLLIDEALILTIFVLWRWFGDTSNFLFSEICLDRLDIPTNFAHGWLARWEDFRLVSSQSKGEHISIMLACAILRKVRHLISTWSRGQDGRCAVWRSHNYVTTFQIPRRRWDVSSITGSRCPCFLCG